MYLLVSAVGLYSNSFGQQPTKQVTAQSGITFAYSTDKQVLAKGQQLFQQNCTACHNFLQKGIGPNLAGVTSEVTPEWLKSFIRNAPQKIEQKDARAVRLFAEYKQYMPTFSQLSDSDTDALVAFLHAKRQRTPNVGDDKKLGVALTDPIPARIQQSGLRLHLTEVTTAPASAEKVPLARINKMQVLPGKPDRLFLEDLRGTLYEMVGDSLRVFMSFPNERPAFIHSPGHATGFGSYAFHPDFHTNGLFYTTHTEKPNTAPADFAYADSIKVSLQWVLTEWKLTDPAAKTFSGSGRELMRTNMVTTIHGVQEITFNPLAKAGSPDYGLLYIGVGDGGATENGYYFLCKDRNRVWGKVLRIDPKGTNSKNGRYGIPAQNPYAGANSQKGLPEVFCGGFRNPNRIAWTPDGKMLISDIGQAQSEELNIGVAGADYGWPEREGTFVINHRGRMDQVYALPKNDADFKYTYPVVQYDHDEGNAISSGFVYTGTAIPALTGKYIFGDIVNGRVYYVDSKQLQPGKQAPIQEFTVQVGGQNSTFQQLTNSKKTDLRFGVGLNNEFYLYTKADGKIYKVTDCSIDKSPISKQ
ncbi:PQQ-dependent sugar dehydrogenase [Spirosoma oryzicola]|uniref:PQQ-dependent sugar dehydrogenase n=1 Tax=Spirosoma oryzicola TaxID=2898794 RepID=UPI001E3741E8|nr:PQQ-dependent sugar dehydrogenase [Spirosoma oryzicola]UHG94087.1 PQQ-dependent sugar dehydrogenase [Spirosoma oryzicola]